MTPVEDIIKESIKPGIRTAVLGVGSVLRSDDAVGTYFAEKLSELNDNKSFLSLAGASAPENLTGVIRKFRPDILFVVDAARMDLEPGTIKEIDPGEISGMTFSTHMLPLPVMLNYLSLDRDFKTVYIGIQPECTEQGIGMCGEVRTAADTLAETFIEAIKNNE